MPSARRVLWAASCGFIAWGLAVGPLKAQALSGGVSTGVLTLNRVQARLDEGRVREARGELERWWAQHQVDGGTGELQRALWLRALLTVDPRIADVDFRRLVLEFEDGPYAGQARLRLGQSAHALGDMDAAREHYLALERDYPRSGLRLAARSWLDRYADGATAVPLGRTMPPAVTPAEPAVRPDDTASAVRAAQVLSVELGVFRDPRVAAELRERALSAGLAPRITRRPDGSSSVRVGRFVHRDEALALRHRALTLGFQARLIPAESP